MLIQNLTVFVQHATKLQMDQVLTPELTKYNDRINHLELTQKTSLETIESYIKNNVQKHADIVLKDKSQINSLNYQKSPSYGSNFTSNSQMSTKNNFINFNASPSDDNSLMAIFGAGNKLMEKKLEMEQQMGKGAGAKNSVEKGNI